MRHRSSLTYYRSAGARESSPFKKAPRPRRRVISRVMDFVILAAVLAGAIYSLIIRPEPKVVLSSAVYRPASVYRETAAESFRSLGNRNKLTLNENAVTENLQKKFPEITRAVVELPIFSQTPTLRLTIAHPKLVLNSQDVDYIVNSRGIVVAKKENLPGIKDAAHIIDQSGFKARVGQQVLSSKEVNFIETVLAQSSRAKVPIASLTLPAQAMELDVRTSDKSYFVKFYLGGDALVQAGQFLAARQQFDQAGTQPAQYLDVRVPGKIYYK